MVTYSAEDRSKEWLQKPFSRNLMWLVEPYEGKEWLLWGRNCVAGIKVEKEGPKPAI